MRNGWRAHDLAYPGGRGLASVEASEKSLGWSGMGERVVSTPNYIPGATPVFWLPSVAVGRRAGGEGGDQGNAFFKGECGRPVGRASRDTTHCDVEWPRCRLS